MRKQSILFLLLCVLLACGVCLCAQAETKTFSRVSDAVKYAQKNQPSELTLEGVKFKPSELLQVKNALPAGAEFHFTSTWGKKTISDSDTELDLRDLKAAVTEEQLEALVAVCPSVTRIDHSTKRGPSNEAMIRLIEKYPGVHFDWLVSFGHGHYCATTATTFSTMLPPSSGRELTSKKLQLLKYCPNLKALDLGHNDLTDLDFLQYVPDLELLIIGQNHVKDITPIGRLKHLQYAELFTNPFTDLSPLANCTELLDLNITNVQAPDFSPLDNITTLERFWANMIKKLTQEEIDRFKALHPDCETDFQPSHAATVDGWRKHPRYRHYIWCFKNRTWIPFDQPLPGQ